MVLDHDDLEITQSCEVFVPRDLVIEDRGEPGVIQVTGSGITIRFQEGSALRGAEAGRPWNQLEGIGIRLIGVHGVTLQGVRAHGFRSGIWASGCDRLTVEDADLSDNFRQRLGSTPLAEDGADWLWPHQNDGNEWLQAYGAALYLEDGEGAVVRRVRVRRGQNGVVLDRMNRSQVYDNDCSFLSGWGLALWRSSGNTVCRNAFDFCVRGYSHGVYNRGQDSAGILMFEQCSENRFVENSVTHGGDGLFGFAGREALGEDGVHPEEWYRRRGNNDNLFLRNDFSYAPAHGIEMTFSFGNRFIANRLVGNAICGIWGGFSQDSLILANEIAENGGMGYGLERGGVNIDRSRGNRILGNRFRDNRCGVHIWSLPTSFTERPWGRANDLRAEGTVVSANRFDGDELALHLRGDCAVRWGGNLLEDVGKSTEVEPAARLEEAAAAVLPPVPSFDDLPGVSRPVGARAEIAGRENIVVGPWGPWDHEEALLLVHSAGPGFVTYQSFPRGLELDAEWIDGPPPGVVATELESQSGERMVRFEATEPGLHRFQARILAGEDSWPVEGWLLLADWEVRFFPWRTDPREDYAGWLAEADAAPVVVLPGLEFHFDSGGPEGYLPDQERSKWQGGADHFGTLASARIPLPAGRYRVRTLSDDGIRVRVDGDQVVEDWTWHAPKEAFGQFELREAQVVQLEVEHFEIDGFAKLVVTLERED
ncbi:MAG: right-handed parallel beta-helix repeat-containing protein [Planctomycetes bacterium]|nr:right-handed parallel beta-helix repeat-containing protein [Planctomycetota bacterium]